jgi:hypothetical protein
VIDGSEATYHEMLAGSILNDGNAKLMLQVKYVLI